jgi:hypothetical protein
MLERIAEPKADSLVSSVVIQILHFSASSVALLCDLCGSRLSVADLLLKFRKSPTEDLFLPQL